ncbi:MAG: O-antigen ligase family protein [Deltaproteobacteria bacterium]|nr:O-antigen ligase family protein [Deltaproteobacteria bacterium]
MKRLSDRLLTWSPPTARTFLTAGLLALLTLTWILVGGVHAESQVILSWGALGLGVAALVLALWHKRALAASFGFWLLALLALVPLVQILPLPFSVMRTIDPITAGLAKQVTSRIPGATAALSWDRTATLLVVLVRSSMVALFVTASILARGNDAGRRLAWAIDAILLTVGALSLLNWVSGDPRIWWVYQPNYHGAFFAPMVNENHASGLYLMALCLHVGLSFSVPASRKRHVLLGLALIPGLLVLLAQSRGGYAGALVGLAVLSALLWRIKKIPSSTFWQAVAAVALVIVALVPSVGLVRDAFGRQGLEKLPEDSKIVMWGEALPLMNRHLVAGTGAGTYQQAFARVNHRVQARTVSHAENWLVEMGVEMGPLFTILILILGIWGAIRFFKKNRLDEIQAGMVAGVAGILVQNLGDFNLDFPGTAFLTAVFAGFLSGRCLTRIRSVKKWRRKHRRSSRSGPIVDSTPSLPAMRAVSPDQAATTKDHGDADHGDFADNDGETSHGNHDDHSATSGLTNDATHADAPSTDGSLSHHSHQSTHDSVRTHRASSHVSVPNFAAVGLVLLTGIIVAITGSKQAIRHNLRADTKQAARLLAKNEFPQAHRFLLEALRRHPMDDHLQLLMGWTEFRLGTGHPLAWLNHSLLLNPYDSGPHLVAAQVLANSGLIEQAATEYRRGFDLGGRRLTTKPMLKQMVRLAAQLAASVENEHLAFRAAGLSARLALVGAWPSLALALGQVDDRITTVATSRRVTLPLPEKPSVWKWLGNGLLETTGKKLGAAVLQATVERWPKQQDALARLVSYHLRNGQSAQALWWAKELLDVDPSPKNFLMAARLTLRVDGATAAAKILARGVRQHPDQVVLRIQLAQMALKLHQDARAKRTVDDIMGRRNVPLKDRVGLLQVLLEVARRQGDSREVRHLQHRLIRLKFALDSDPGRSHRRRTGTGRHENHGLGSDNRNSRSRQPSRPGLTSHDASHRSTTSSSSP